MKMKTFYLKYYYILACKIWLQKFQLFLIMKIYPFFSFFFFFEFVFWKIGYKALFASFVYTNSQKNSVGIDVFFVIQLEIKDTLMVFVNTMV